MAITVNRKRSGTTARKPSATRKPRGKRRPRKSSLSQPIQQYTETAMREYGVEVVEQRAVPDFRDGLKPVQRAILWAMYKLSLHHKGAYKKSARTVGDVIGQYHPHGDIGTYGAMVNLVNSSVGLVDGAGNWGNFRASAAAFRYTESRLSEFSDRFLLDSDYVAVSDMVPNFSQDKEQPVILPAKLPVMLLNGSVSIAFGVAANCPPFHPEGVTRLVRLALRGKTITPALCLKYLKFNYKYGGVCKSSDEELLEFYKTGTGPIKFMPEYSVDRRRKEIVLTSVCPGGLTSDSGLRGFMNKCAEIDGVRDVSDQSGKNKRTGKKGFRVVIQAGQRCRSFDDIVEKVERLMLKTERMNIGVTERKIDGTALFRRESVPSIINQWVEWRIDLEVRVLNLLISRENTKLERQSLLLYAVDHLDAIFKALRSRDPKTTLIRLLKVTDEKANAILDLKVRQLAKLERAGILDNIKKIESEIVGYKRHLRKPQVRIDSDLAALGRKLSY
jgi:DNA gyrase/topoisomerase IV subunit A